ncbi:MAG: hypothetical protein O6952_05525 [Planctomycetota bacterium]|nr:hypothetical protein [Planctomycetota bacterium]
MTCYPLDRLHQEVAFIAYHFHWPLSEILDLPHPHRQRWVNEISAINERLNRAQEES